MTSTRTHTHNGNCQVCGRQQAVDINNGTLAKHGYTVESGFFNGTCRGSHESPLQVSREVTDSIINSLALRAAELAHTIEQHTARPQNVEHFDDQRRPVHNARFERTMIAWSTANAYSRERGTEVFYAKLDSERRWALGHAKMMEELAKRLFGTDLIPVEVEQRAKSERTGKRAAAGARKEALYRLARAFERGYDEIEAIYLALPRQADGYRRIATEAQEATYGGVMYPHQWTEKRRAAVLAAWAGNQQVIDIVAKLDAIVAEHRTVKGN